MIDTKTFQPRDVGKPTPTEQQLAVVRFSPCGKILAAGLNEQERRMIFFDNYNNILRQRGLHAN